MTEMAVAALALLDAALAEVALFAGVMILIGGLDDLAVDIVWRWHRRPDPLLADLPSAPPLRLAVFIPAWDEARVIGAMLRAALARYDHPDYTLCVGCYPNDGETIAAVQAVAAQDVRVRLVLNPVPGPTTKADCLNSLWRALVAHDAAAGRPTDAIVLHDAEDVVHPAELRVFDHHLRTAALVQVPVVPLIDPRTRLVSGHYADEFAGAHSRDLPARAALGAALPLAGVGCAIRRDALDRLTAMRDGAPVEAQSLTEDYELGLRVGAMGLGACFARWRERAGGPLVATRAYFPDTADAAVRQKARWLTGIALAGWDRIGWGQQRRPAELWMRMRDRRGLLAALVLLAAYATLAGEAISVAAHVWRGDAAPVAAAGLRALLIVNAGLLTWRLWMRVRLTAADHGWREGIGAIPRVVAANMIAMMAARRALAQYWQLLWGAPPHWDKTAHRFPAILPDRA